MRKIIFALVLGPAAFCFGDTLSLKTGENIEGTYLGGTARVLRMEINGQVQSFDISNVAGLQFGNGSATAPLPPPATPPQQDDRRPLRPEPQYSSSNNSAPPSAQQGIELRAGTQLTVRMIDSVDSESARTGDTFRASLDEPVMINGQPVVQRGSDVVVKLVEDQQSGKISGRAVLKLALVSLKVNDRMVDVTTQDVQKESGSRGARSAGVIGGTAALGAIIGGIAGGGKGAAIGAGSGAAVGTGAEVLTKGQRVRIPSETRLVFALSYTVRI
jgi:hypothetical protein